MKNLSHSASFESLDKNAPAKSGTKQLVSMFDNPTAVCLTPAKVERVLRDAGFRIEGTETMLPGITMLTRASKPSEGKYPLLHLLQEMSGA